MNNILEQFDEWLTAGGPAAVVRREPLVPVEGPDGVFFPATYAATDDRTFPGGYNIDDLGNGENVCLVDSVGSQANRIEPLFASPAYAGLVPQVWIEAGGHRINLLQAGHRAADAIVRCSALKEEVRAAFAALQRDATPLAKLAPTSLVFGAWDSRDTQTKVPRLIASTVRAYNVRVLTRSAQYVPAIDYVAAGVLDAPADKKARDAYAERGFAHVPSSGQPGGVIATKGIRREAVLHLAALRQLKASSEESTLALRRYVLGLSLTAFTHVLDGYLRQGCNLVPDPDAPAENVLVHANGRRERWEISHEDAVAYARGCAEAFGIGQDKVAAFDKERAIKDLAGDGKKSKARKGS